MKKSIDQDRNSFKNSYKPYNYVQYDPPLIVSVTSVADKATGKIWPMAKPGRRTVGHDATLFTHSVSFSTEGVCCDPRDNPKNNDWGQNFHCLRPPEPPVALTPKMIVDLPLRDREGERDWPEHGRFSLNPIGSFDKSEIFWNFQVPPELISNHNDIFNSRSASMILALIQMSGAVASLAENWQDSFEIIECRD